MNFTETDFNSWRFNRDAVHFNGGNVFFGWGHKCVDQPRLLVIDKYFKKDRSTKRSYLVDGRRPFDNLDAALAALSVAPSLTDEERLTLAGLPDGWSRPEKRAPLVPLAEMGFVEWGRDADDNVTCRRTTSGTAALPATREMEASNG